VAELNFGRVLRHAARYSDDVAIVDLGTGHEASYAEHLGRIARACAAMRELGIAPSDPFAVLAGASHGYVELWRAALAGGGVINPLNTRLAAEEIFYILNDSGAEVVFVDTTHAPTLAAARERLPKLRLIVQLGDAALEPACDLRLEDLLAAAGATQALPAEPGEDDAAVLMYTGGTTGLPKGVVLSQRAIVLVIHRMAMAYPIEPGMRFLSFMPLFHIGGISAWGLLLPFGGRSVILPSFEPAAVNAAIQTHEIQMIGAVPTMLALMLEHESFASDALASLRLILYGAAPMPPPLLSRLMTLFPKLALGQAYGMTECASTATALTPQDHERGGEILRSVGRTLLGVELEVRDADGVSLPQGEIGEIYLRCDSLMTEYWAKPEQTAASLVDGWYRTGDAGRVDPEGYLFLADRVKDMIVTGGENVYSLDVEHAIVSHPSVRQVAVVGIPDDTWGERVHAFVVCDPATTTENDLEAHARQTIAGFKVPRSWTLQDAPLPLSAAGKVLKRTLRERLT